MVRAIEEAVTDDEARVMLVGSASGGAAAAEIAASLTSAKFVVDQVVTAGSPSAQVPLIPEPTRVLSLEDRADPVALLGSLINARITNRLTVVFDGSAADGTHAYVAGGRAADSAEHPELRAEIAPDPGARLPRRLSRHDPPPPAIHHGMSVSSRFPGSIDLGKCPSSDIP